MNDKSPIFRSLLMIEENIRERLTVEMLAAGINFSKYHYQRIFHEAVGDTVMGYVTKRKLFLAARELAETKDSVLEIALRYGYDSHEGFTRSFKAHFGVTPKEYRKYHFAISFPERKKEQSTMVRSKYTDELIKGLNSLIVQAKETAKDTREYRGADAQAIVLYKQFWELIAERTEKMAEELQKSLKSVTTATQDSDEISAHFLLVKAIDDTAFEAGVTAFQAGLMISRTIPEHKAVFQPLCVRYDRLAQESQIKSRKIVDFLNELSDLILRDMRKQAEQRIKSAVESGRAAAEKLSDPTLPYIYIADGITAVADELDSLALEDITLSYLTDSLSALDTIRFAACMDILRAPQHRQLFDGISNFKEKLAEAAKFFRDLTGDGLWVFRETKKDSEKDFAEEISCKELAMQEGVALFYLKGEIHKLENAHLGVDRKTAFSAICSKIDRAIKICHSSVNKEEKNKIAELLCEAYNELISEADRLEPYGGAIRYLAEKVKMPLDNLVGEKV